MVKVLSGEQAMVEFGRQLGKSITAPILIFLTGDLGAGKTTLCRGILGAFGHKGSVKSPTYTLVEPYQFGGDGLVYHFDLYRLGIPRNWNLSVFVIICRKAAVVLWNGQNAVQACCHYRPADHDNSR